MLCELLPRQNQQQRIKFLGSEQVQSCVISCTVYFHSSRKQSGIKNFVEYFAECNFLDKIVIRFQFGEIRILWVLTIFGDLLHWPLIWGKPHYPWSLQSTLMLCCPCIATSSDHSSVPSPLTTPVRVDTDIWVAGKDVGM